MHEAGATSMHTMCTGPSMLTVCRGTPACLLRAPSVCPWPSRSRRPGCHRTGSSGRSCPPAHGESPGGVGGGHSADQIERVNMCGVLGLCVGGGRGKATRQSRVAEVVRKLTAIDLEGLGMQNMCQVERGHVWGGGGGPGCHRTGSSGRICPPAQRANHLAGGGGGIHTAD
jgi:hypothetical protein